jgi:hypothetical protein
MVEDKTDAVGAPAQRIYPEPFTPADIRKRLVEGFRWAIENWITIGILLYIYVTIIGLAFTFTFEIRTGIKLSISTIRLIFFWQDYAIRAPSRYR